MATHGRAFFGNRAKDNKLDQASTAFLSTEDEIKRITSVLKRSRIIVYRRHGGGLQRASCQFRRLDFSSLPLQTGSRWRKKTLTEEARGRLSLVNLPARAFSVSRASA